ncbi:magnesium transporter [Numidum massiliense]|uniref:magnesium transporter n=1 Tax=Numidum massiliense TaxID=1522315 RepID=UPI0006D59C16|nr:magnesium transporter [Numidum massiliense]
MTATATREALLDDIRHILQSDDPATALLERVESLQPYDLDEILQELTLDEQLTFLSALPFSLAAETLEYAEPERQYQILHHLNVSITSRLLRHMSSDTVVDMLLSLHPLQQARLLDLLPDDYRQKIDTLMTFPEDTAGSLATVEYISARVSWTVEQALSHVRKVGHEAELISYIYVINVYGELVGVVSLKDAILAPPDTRLRDIVTSDVISVSAHLPQEDAADILTRYDFVALPVVSEQRLIGIITVDDLIDVIHEEATEDIQKLGGSQPLSESYFKTPIWVLFRKRIVWLVFLFVAAAYTGTIMHYFEDVLSQMVSLSFFIPLLIGTGGNTGSQTVSTLVRALAVGEVTFQDMFRVLAREIATGLLLGLALGAIAYVRAAMLGVDFKVGAVVSLTAFAIVIWASIVAAVLPLILHRLKMDPAVVSAPLITTLVDGTGLILYFTIARLILNL